MTEGSHPNRVENEPDEKAEPHPSLTSKQMLAAPRGAVYVWPHHDLYYPRKLAEHLMRTDLFVTPPSVFDTRGRQFRGVNTRIVLDHATKLNHEQQAVLDEWNGLIAGAKK